MSISKNIDSVLFCATKIEVNDDHAIRIKKVLPLVSSSGLRRNLFCNSKKNATIITQVLALIPTCLDLG